MITMKGRVVYVKPEKSKAGKYYKRLQIQVGGQEERVSTFDVTDMSNSEWEFGREYELVVQVRPFQGKSGLGLNWTCWDGPTSNGTSASIHYNKPGEAKPANGGVRV